jgi:hypothetical protein
VELACFRTKNTFGFKATGWYSPVREVDDDHGRSTEGSEYGELDREGNDDGNEAERLRDV